MAASLPTALEQLPLPEQSSDIKTWGNVKGGALPYLLWEYVRHSKAPCLFIARDSQEAHSIESSVRFFQTSDERSALPIVNFPDWETLPYDIFSPHEDIISSRLSALVSASQMKQGLVVVALPTLLQRIAPTSFLEANSFQLTSGQTFDTQSYRERLETVGYRHVDTVYEHGEYTVRGSIIDVFPMGSELPVRIELFDDEIESLRHFDPDSQRSLKPVKALSMLPANEFPWDKASRLAFRNSWLETFPNASTSSPFIRDLKEGIKPHGLEYYAPLFFDSMANLFDYLPASLSIFSHQDISKLTEDFIENVNERYEERRHDIQRPILSPNNLFLASNEFFSVLKPYKRVAFSHTKLEEKGGTQNIVFADLPSVSVDEREEDSIKALKNAVDSAAKDQFSTLVVAESNGRREILLDLFKRNHLVAEAVQDWSTILKAIQNASSTSLYICVGDLAAGCILPDRKLQIVTESELYGQRVQQSRRRNTSTNQAENLIKNLSELQIGFPVVHIDHGVGRYRGLETIEVDGRSNEFLTLEYAQGSKLYVPVSSLNLISRYSGTDENLAPLHKLGTEKWSVAKQKAMEKVRDTAAELLEVYAKREAKEGFPYEYPGQSYRSFCASFPFEETADQSVAINAVVQDMTRSQPMDRLVCGDVGFGKTEVAMRAAFIATHNSKQVAVLVPTTLLAQQHYESFVDRFSDTPVKVEVLSRFKTTAEQNKCIADIEAGKVDIVVGTHKLIQGEINFKNLGLLIIDEEHRFGVQQKERLKALRAQVDILTLTATPIPRTLNMAMGGIRDLSIIATPPAKRLSVKTFVREREDSLIRESVLREILRGGQVYYLFNDVKNMEKEVAHLQELVPEARVGFAHGQMRERELEQAMSDFYHLRYNILVCSTIIETGIDIPNANTIIIDRADKFGLAQLHQLRGRVGRSHHQAYAYLLTPPSKALSKDAEKRLEAIESSQELGAGFMLATHDLEIRGAGELLGEDQSGQIQNIGYSLYMELLERAVESLKAGRALNIEQDVHGTEVSLQLSAIIPDEYLPDVHNRLILYKRIASASSDDELKELQVEMIDRFGLLPEPCKHLFRQTSLKLRLENLGIQKLDAGKSSGKLEFSSNTSIEPLAIVKLVQSRPDLYRLEGASTLKFPVNATNEEELFQAVESVINKLEN